MSVLSAMFGRQTRTQVQPDCSALSLESTWTLLEGLAEVAWNDVSPHVADDRKRAWEEIDRIAAVTAQRALTLLIDTNFWLDDVPSSSCSRCAHPRTFRVELDESMAALGSMSHQVSLDMPHFPRALDADTNALFIVLQDGDRISPFWNSFCINCDHPLDWYPIAREHLLCALAESSAERYVRRYLRRRLSRQNTHLRRHESDDSALIFIGTRIARSDSTDDPDVPAAIAVNSIPPPIHCRAEEYSM